MNIPPEQAHGTTECWNCEVLVDRATQVIVRSPVGRQVVLTLCPTCFTTVYLPLAEEAADLCSDCARGETVLVVEDDPDMLNALAICLHEAGFRVSTARNGIEALERACHRVPDAIVLDIRMPIMNGPEFLRVWRRTVSARSVPIVAMSGYDRDVTSTDLGVDAILHKPFTPDALVGVLVGAIGRQ